MLLLTGAAVFINLKTDLNEVEKPGMFQLLVQYLIRRNQMPFGKYADSCGFVSFSYWKAKDAKERQR